MIERNLDYVQCAIMLSEEIFLDKNMPKVSPLKFYSRGYMDEFGARIYFGNPNSKKALYIASGNVVQNWRDSEKSDFELLELLLKYDAAFSRIDMAITDYIEESFVTVEDVSEWLKKDLITSSHVKYGGKMIDALVAGDDKATHETFYIGDLKKRADRGIFRAYDKGVEWDLSPYLITRIEIEERKENAHKSAIRLVESENIGSVFRSRFDVASNEFERLVSAEAVSISRGRGLKRDDYSALNARWEWLMKQVAPALKDAIKQDREFGMKDNRLYWFLRESGFSHEQILKLVDKEGIGDDNSSND